MATARLVPRNAALMRARVLLEQAHAERSPDVRLRFDLDTSATPDELQTLLKLTERYCVVYQTLKNPPTLEVAYASP